MKIVTPDTKYTLSIITDPPSKLVTKSDLLRYNNGKRTLMIDGHAYDIESTVAMMDTTYSHIFISAFLRTIVCLFVYTLLIVAFTNDYPTGSDVNLLGGVVAVVYLIRNNRAYRDDCFKVKRYNNSTL